MTFSEKSWFLGDFRVKKFWSAQGTLKTVFRDSQKNYAKGFSRSENTIKLSKFTFEYRNPQSLNVFFCLAYTFHQQIWPSAKFRLLQIILVSRCLTSILHRRYLSSMKSCVTCKSVVFWFFEKILFYKFFGQKLAFLGISHKNYYWLKSEKFVKNWDRPNFLKT